MTSIGYRNTAGEDKQTPWLSDTFKVEELRRLNIEQLFAISQILQLKRKHSLKKGLIDYIMKHKSF